MKTPTLDGSWIILDPENDPRSFGTIRGHKGPSKSDFRCRFPQEGIRAVCGSYPAAHRLGFEPLLEVGSRTEKPGLCEEKWSPGSPKFDKHKILPTVHGWQFLGLTHLNPS